MIAARAASSTAAAEDVLAQLAHPTRLRLLYAIHAAPGSTVSELAAATDISPNNATKALGHLLNAGLLSCTPHGRRRRWALTDPAAHQLLHQLGAPHSHLHPPH